MKKLIMMLVSAMCISSCDNVVFDDNAGSNNSPTKKFTFTLKGDFSNSWKPVSKTLRKTVGYLQADGKDMTDVWVLDYMDNELVQQLHQADNTAEDFGKPVLNLKHGSHHIYFIASRGSEPVLNTTDKTLTFTKVLDTFWQDYEVSVVSTSNGNRAVTLDRIITKLRLEFTDAVPDGTGSINITPGVWYFGFNYQTGEPCAAVNNQEISIPVPSSCYGNTGQGANIHGFSSATEWTTDIAFNSKKANGDIIGSATIANAPFKRNRVTEYKGPFGSEGTAVLTLNTDWDTQFDGTW